MSALHARKTQFVWVVSIVALTVNLALNFAWDPRWGMYGAAWATTLAYGVEGLLMYLYGQRVYNLPVNGWRILTGLSIFSVLLALTQVSFPDGTRTVIIGCGFALSITLFWFMLRSDLTLLNDLLHRSDSH